MIAAVAFAPFDRPYEEPVPELSPLKKRSMTASFLQPGTYLKPGRTSSPGAYPRKLPRTLACSTGTPIPCTRADGSTGQWFRGDICFLFVTVTVSFLAGLVERRATRQHQAQGL